MTRHPQIVDVPTGQDREASRVSGQWTGLDGQQGFCINMQAHLARWRGKPLALRPNELRLLALLVAHSDQLLTREQLIAKLGKGDRAIDPRTVDVWIGRLRRALRESGAPDALRTVHSLGYVFDTLAPAEMIWA